MAEFVMKDLVRKAGVEGVEIESAALHTDEIGNDIHYGTRAKLREMGVSFTLVGQGGFVIIGFQNDAK